MSKPEGTRAITWKDYTGPKNLFEGHTPMNFFFPANVKEKLLREAWASEQNARGGFITERPLTAADRKAGEAENPKDKFGKLKVSLSKVPAVAVAWCAKAMMAGARKYGAYNWRSKDVIASVYVDAAKRHLDLWFEGQEISSDDKVHHLGHVMACCAILLDAQTGKNLKDDRPPARDLEALYNALIEETLPQAMVASGTGSGSVEIKVPKR